MQKRSHAQLAAALLRSESGFSARRYELAFLFGSFQPDCNPFSYLRGFRRGKKFGGHTYGNARPYIGSRIRKLQSRERWNLWHYYALGQLTHYVSDAFTYPHNPEFARRGWAHHVYETDLRLRLREYLAAKPPCRREARGDLPELLDALHRRYASGFSGVSGPERDIRYILRANEMLMAGCRPAVKVGRTAQIPA